jgi:peptide deformylase
MNILTYPNDILRQKTLSVDKVTPELVNIAKEMYRLMRESNGIGLAANQVGLNISLIVIENQGHMLAMFNPVILHRSPQVEYAGEGCLSFAGVFRMIKRPLEISVKYRDGNGKMSYGLFKGLQARCILHEVEHLHGKLFIDIEEKA